MQTSDTTVFRVVTEVTVHYFDTLEEARKLTGDYYEMFGIILSIESVPESEMFSPDSV